MSQCLLYLVNCNVESMYISVKNSPIPAAQPIHNSSVKNKALSMDQHVALAYCITPQEISALYAVPLLNTYRALCPLAVIRPVHHTEWTSTPLLTLTLVADILLSSVLL